MKPIKPGLWWIRAPGEGRWEIAEVSEGSWSILHGEDSWAEHTAEIGESLAGGWEFVEFIGTRERGPVTVRRGTA